MNIKVYMCILIIDTFLTSDKYTRFCQWKNLELNISVNYI
jgi:hypothetical protein